MNRIVRILAVMLTALGLAACATGPKIQTDYDQNVDFSQFKTYGFYNPMSIEGPNYSTIFGQYFREALRREMNARGYTESQSEPDLMLNVSASLQNKVNVTEMPNPGPYGYYGYRRGYYDPWGGYGWGSTTHVSQYTEGTVNVDMVDRDDKRMVWEGVAIGTVREGRSREEVKASINEGVARMFEGFPFRAGQG